ncbi:hypothetical protein ACFWIA_20395 [Streptomyces sp. NPDC127068]|uniref:hypothetical protein n=1 Tax=Streptomyces sp. NPDC127068 TaxID=3347127 RepID=UPI00366808C0
MITGLIDPLIAPLHSSPFRALLGSRLGLVAQSHSALVFLADDGADRVEPPRGPAPRWSGTPYPRPPLGQVWNGRFRRVSRVSLVERRCTVEVAAGGPLRPPQHHQVAWRIGDPVTAVRGGLTEEAARQVIARDVAAPAGTPDPLRQPPPRHGAPVLAPPPGQPRVIEGVGIVYWLLDQVPGPLTGAVDAGPVVPPLFGEAQREAYRFYREVVAGGPADLVAFWLFQHPDQARDVLDWTVAHRDLLTDRDGWEHSLAATLRGLNGEHRGLVGVNVAHLLREVGLPQGDEVLRRMQRDGVPGAAANGAPPDGAGGHGAGGHGSGAHRRSA